MTRRILFALAPVALLLSSCDIEDAGSWGSSDRYREDFHYNYALKSGGSLSVDNFNGSIEVISWEKDEVEVNGTKYAGSEDLLRQIKIEADSQPGSLRLRTVRPEPRRGNCGAKYILRVPKKLMLNGIVSSNGSIRIENMEGDVRLQSSNGSIRVRGLVGKVDAKTSNASVEGNGVVGDFVARTSNGSVKVDGLQGAFEANTSNSSIVARIEKMPAGRSVKADTSNGSVDLSLPDYKDQPVDASTSNSSITLRLPASAKADLRASTSNSSVSTDFEVLMSGSISKNRLEGRIGGGGTPIRLSTSNGSVRVQKL
ncbi:DUF4097 family beta strand repeat-containing protein [Bryobacter aggregatus]|uniref:DUF4097 family beta strand repeat-containing protein n=1 Tax=Bryobacter aggregatus TaxID=360054 RepID=UPI0004E26744|nr:DUF4097 family beta strand repeat-containing protein [Bryobacter aggregatus]